MTMATTEYCERCRCKTLHIPFPTGERICEWHLNELPPAHRAPALPTEPLRPEHAGAGRPPEPRK